MNTHGMSRVDIANLEHASRSAMAYMPDFDREGRIARVMTATVPAIGILAACALVLVAVL